jgi:hypothetical protein
MCLFWGEVKMRCKVFKSALFLIYVAVGFTACVASKVENTPEALLSNTDEDEVLLSSTPITPTVPIQSTEVGSPPTPSPTSTLPPAITPSSTPIPTSTLTPVPLTHSWDFEEAFNAIPEISRGLMSEADVDHYHDLVSRLPLEGQKWVLSMGEFVANAQLDAPEELLLNYLADETGLTNLVVLSDHAVLDGLTAAEADAFCNVRAVDYEHLLVADVQELVVAGLLDEAQVEGLQTLVARAGGGNFELQKGLVLMHHYGHPNQTIFSYPVPTYNTQLLMLARIIEQGVPEGYEIAAVAAALDYGSLWTIANDGLRDHLVEYAVSRIQYQEETDKIIWENGARWQARLLPLEGQIALVWGSQGNNFPLTSEDAERLKISFDENEPWSAGPWRGYREMFGSRKMTLSDFDFVFTEKTISEDSSLQTMERMRSYMIEYYNFNNIDDISSAIFVNIFQIGLEYVNEISWQQIDGFTIFDTCIFNADWQWKRYETEGSILGTSCEGYMHSTLMASVNIPAITPTYYMHHTGYYDYSSGVWRASQGELENEICLHHLDSRLGWNAVPFLNYHNLPHQENWTGRLRVLLPMNTSIWQDGIPGGLLVYRSDVTHEASPANMCR